MFSLLYYLHILAQLCAVVKPFLNDKFRFVGQSLPLGEGAPKGRMRE